MSAKDTEIRRVKERIESANKIENKESRGENVSANRIEDKRVEERNMIKIRRV